MSKQIAFLGLGVMGAPMTANLVHQGYQVKAWNRTPHRPGVELARNAGAAIAASIQEAVQGADFVFTCVGDVADVGEVILGKKGAVNYAQAGTLIVDFSTIGSQAAGQIARELQQRNLRFMEAPISGGDIGARQGTLTIMVGGEQEDFAECKPYLEAMGKTVRLCGPVGSGQAVKLCNQVLAAVQMVALCEAMEMARQQGIDPNLMIEVCSTGAAGSWSLANLGPKIAREDYEPGFTIEHILKDLRLIKETLSDAEEKLPGVELATQLFKKVAQMEQGAQQGTQAMMRAYLDY